jgi:hypothetical protein
MVALAALAAGCRASPYACSTHAQCVRGDERGRCEPTRRCSFPDAACPYARRYPELGADDLDGTCTGPWVVTVSSSGASDYPEFAAQSGGAALIGALVGANARIDGELVASTGKVSSVVARLGATGLVEATLAFPAFVIAGGSGAPDGATSSALFVGLSETSGGKLFDGQTKEVTSFASNTFPLAVVRTEAHAVVSGCAPPDAPLYGTPHPGSAPASGFVASLCLDTGCFAPADVWAPCKDARATEPLCTCRSVSASSDARIMAAGCNAFDRGDCFTDPLPLPLPRGRVWLRSGDAAWSHAFDASSYVHAVSLVANHDPDVVALISAAGTLRLPPGLEGAHCPRCATCSAASCTLTMPSAGAVLARLLVTRDGVRTVWAQLLEGSVVVVGNALPQGSGAVYVAGNYCGTLSLDGAVLDGPSCEPLAYSSFVAAVDVDSGNVRAARSLAPQGALYIQALGALGGEHLVAGATFQGAFTVGETPVSSPSSVDSVFVQLRQDTLQ